ncbi:DUF5684 domain-containing protein [Microbacterium sp. SS28]|uniref:DUF5684 domain-containing protein n=1 Tax=Microbacterium sp. SS28 TaxID=2919948 RepID=UPI001FA94FED|nr:DUF5684 domain-containing protein [Microbacterium sp. SS28]
MTNLELSNTVAVVTTSLVAVLLVYVWIAIALGAVFRKSGEPAWQAWVPFLNIVVLLRLGGLSGWLVLLFVLPLVGWIALIVAVHRVNLAFGYGGGMTALAFFLFPIWASIVGFGPERWVGRDAAKTHGPVRTPQPETFTAGPAEPAAAVTAYSPITPPPGYAAVRGGYVPAAPAAPPAPPAAPAAPAAGGWAPPPPLPTQPVPYTPATSRASTPAAEEAAAPAAATPAPATPDAPATAAPVPPASTPALSDEAPSYVRRSSTPQRPYEDDEDRYDESWSFDAIPGSATSEVTDAVSGAPAPISAAPIAGRRVGSPPLAPLPPDDLVPPVTHVPAAADPALSREPWAPAPSPVPGEGDAFPESSGPVSAIAGAPDAGGPRSALASVSAQHTRPHIPEEDDLEETIVARRKRTAWVLVGPTGTRVPLTSEAVILGRRPVRDPEFPGAQLVSLDDDTRTISKTHARLELRDDRWYITDLDSTNGVLFTTVMGTEVAATPGEATEAGERFLLGDAEVSLSRSEP